MSETETLRAEIKRLQADVARIRADRTEWRALCIWLIGLMCDDCRKWLRK